MLFRSVCSAVRAKNASITDLWKRKEMAVTARICTAVLDVTAGLCTAKNTECVSECRLCMDLPFWVPGWETEQLHCCVPYSTYSILFLSVIGETIVVNCNTLVKCCLLLNVF